MSTRRPAPADRSAGVSGLLLAPGFGGDRNQATLVAVEAGVAPLPVSRIDFPYRKEGRRGPDPAHRMIATVVEEAGALAAEAGVDPDRLVLGGRSMGGRMCSMAVAEGLPAAGLALLSYPLHPPGKPDKLRTDHFPALDVPVLFVGGDRDPFGSPEELESAAAAIPGPVTFVWLEGARHDARGRDPVVTAAVADWIAAL